MDGVRFFHRRNIEESLKCPKNPKGISGHGGETIALLEKDEFCYYGVSACHDSDSFEKKRGRDDSSLRLEGAILKDHQRKLSGKIRGTSDNLLSKISVVRYRKGRLPVTEVRFQDLS